MRHFRRTRSATPAPKPATLIMWDALTIEQQEKVRGTFFWVEHRMTSDEYQAWIETGGYYFRRGNLEVSNVYHKADEPA